MTRRKQNWIYEGCPVCRRNTRVVFVRGKNRPPPLCLSCNNSPLRAVALKFDDFQFEPEPGLLTLEDDELAQGRLFQ